MVMDAGALYGRMYGVFSSICSLMSVTVLMCAAFIFAILTAYRRYNEGLYQAAYTDALTGGSNFYGFLMKVNNAEGGYMVSCDLDDYRMIASMFGAQKGDELLRGVYECIKSGLTEGEPVARVDADHFAFHLVERQRSAVLERLRQIERRIRRLSDKMGVIHLVPRFGIYAMRPEEDARRSCELANLALGAARSSADNTVAFYQDLDQNAFFENMQLEDRFDEAIGEHQFATPKRAKSSAARRWFAGCRRTAPCSRPIALSRCLKRTAPSASWMNTCSPASARSSASGAGKDLRFGRCRSICRARRCAVRAWRWRISVFWRATACPHGWCRWR